MEIAAVRTGERVNKAVVVRADGSTDSSAVHDYGPALPHDLAHYVVESELGLQWADVAGPMSFGLRRRLT